MQAKWAHSLLLFFCLFGSVLSASHHRLFLRDDPAPSTTGSSNQTSTLGAATSTAPSPATTTLAGLNSTNRTVVTVTASPTVSGMVLPSDFLNKTLNATMFPANELPLPPEITPAFSVAGVLLMITGTFYCLIGIKKKWIQISISSAYLVALAITVLIVYIVNPPVTYAVQGAYLVAAVAPALLLGGVACIFHDVTEGLGCAVGGFSISMFFMVLTPGGLLTNTASKAIFIGVWTFAIFCFSFSHYTRTYALIGSTAFGGSTAVILGIDCFSRAGLKEFWVYVWGLNSNLFPLLVQSYPLTRGIKVEIAGIVVFSIFGVLSQLKIWKIVQARKEKKEQAKHDADNARDELEAELGRQVEEGNERDRSQWEAIYGEKPEDGQEPRHRDSGVGTEASSTRKASMSVKGEKAMVTSVETEAVPTLPTEEMPIGPVMPHGIVIQVGEDDIPSQVGAASEAGPEEGPESTRELDEEPEPQPAPVLRASRTAAPKQNIPSPTSTTFAKQDDVSSIKAAAEPRMDSSEPSPTESNFSLQVSQPRDLKRLSAISQSSIEAVLDPDMLDELDTTSNSDKETLHHGSQASQSRQASIRSAHTVENIEPESHHDAESQVVPSVAKAASVVDDVASEKRTPSTRKASRAGSVVDDAASQPVALARSESKYAPSVKSVEKTSVRSERPAPAKPTLQNLGSEQANPIIQQFRTNEWAKHLGAAEAPEFDPLRPVDRRERASVVDAAALLQTPLTAEPEPINTESPSSPPPVESPPPQQTPGGRIIPARVPSIIFNGAASPPPSSPGSVGSTGSQRAPRQPQQLQSSARKSSTSALRTSASPLSGTPISENEEMSFQSPRASPLPTGTLLAERNTMLAHKNLTGQMPGRSNSTGPYEGSAASSTASLPHMQQSLSPPLSPQHSVAMLSDDSLPLSARKSHLKLAQQQQHSRMSMSSYTSLSRSSTLPQHQSAHMAPQGAIMTSPPQAARRSTTDPALRQSSMLNAWRTSMVADQRRSAAVDSPWTGDAAGGLAPMAMPAKEPKKVWRDGRTRNGSEGWGSAGEGRSMRQMGAREMDSAHREVLRRMQAGANKKLATEGL